MSDVSGQPGIEVRIEGDGDVARLVIGSDAPAEAVTSEAIEQVLLKRRVEVTPGVQTKLAQIVGRWRKGPTPVDEVIAKATPPRPGRDGGLEFLEGFDPRARTHTSQTSDESGSVDHHCVSAFVSVIDGDHVAYLREAEAGENGRNVFGRSIPAKAGQPGEDVVDQETLALASDGRVTARISGVLLYEDHMLRINPLMVIEEYVDFSTGNLDFDGSVVINEGIRDEFVVKASRDVMVKGLIEAATIICGRDLICRRGMAGKDRGQLVVRGDVTGVFFNNVRGWVDDTLHVARELTYCEIVVAGDFDGPRCSIIGGRISIVGHAEVGSLGSRAGIPTTIMLGSTPRLARKLTKLDQLAGEIRAELSAVQERLRQPPPELADADAANQAAIAQLKQEALVFEVRLEACKRKREEILEEIRRKRMVDLHVNKVIHRGVRLVVGDYVYVFENAYKGPLQIGWKVGEGLFMQQEGATRHLRAA